MSTGVAPNAIARSSTDELNWADHERTEPLALRWSAFSGIWIHSRARTTSTSSRRLIEQYEEASLLPMGEVLDVRADAFEKVSRDPNVNLPLVNFGARRRLLLRVRFRGVVGAL